MMAAHEVVQPRVCKVFTIFRGGLWETGSSHLLTDICTREPVQVCLNLIQQHGIKCFNKFVEDVSTFTVAIFC